jgi:hypothetical protein
MNVVQFWLIDSIVKAGGSAGITLPTDPADHEPLFRSSIDPIDEDDDDGNGAVEDTMATLARRDIEAQGPTRLMRRSNDSSHTYPPSLNGSPPNAPSVHRASQSPPPASRSLSSSRRRRAPPPALEPHSLKVPVLESSDRSSEAGASTDSRPKEEWQAWGGDEDWVERVGEEEWTGRRAEARKREVDGAWRDDVS